MKLVILFEDTVHPHRAGDDTSLPPQRLGLPRHLLVPGSREESTTEMDDEEQEETEREEEEDEEDLELTFLCNPQVLQLKEEVEEGRRRLKECKVYFHKYFSFLPLTLSPSQALIQKLSVDNLRMTGRELSFRSQLEAAARRGANSSSFQETEATTRRGNPTSEAAIRRGSSSTSAVKEASSRVFRGFHPFFHPFLCLDFRSFFSSSFLQ